MVQFERETLKVALTGLPRWKLALFALLCAERISSCFWAFSKRENRERELTCFKDALQFGWENLPGESYPEAARLKRDQLRSIIHHTEEFGDPLAVQAQSASIALAYCLDIDSGSRLDEASWAALHVTEAIHNYVLFGLETCMGVTAGDANTTLLARELDRQGDDITELRRVPRLDASKTASLRVLARFFAVPIAV